MKTPSLDPRTLEELRREVRALAASYTPEWRFEDTQNDPGAALAELFCGMFEQTVDRMNSVPEKLYTEFLNLIGFRLPAPAPASGTMQFTAHETVEEPVRVPAGTQVFTPDGQGDNIIYETERVIEATPARLLDIFYVDGTGDRLERTDLSRPQRFFTPCGENLQRHRFWFSQQDVLRLDCPCTVEIELRQSARYLEEESAKLLEKMQWTYLHEGESLPFDAVRAENGRLVLEKRSSLSVDTDAAGRRAICCVGQPEAALTIEGISLRSAPLARCRADLLFSGDLPIELPEGGYCFGRQPMPYALFYIRSDTVLTKRGATANLRLDITPIVDDPPEQPPQYNFTQAIIDKKGAVERKPDDVSISAVVWEYYNGTGWRRLETEGDRNPFSCKRDGVLETRFTVPADIAPCEVNAEEGMYIRVRVAEVENRFSDYARWIVPFVREAEFAWAYDTLVPAAQCGAENNGCSTEIGEADRVTDLHLPALEPMEQAPRAMYLRFDQSPHAMPLSLLFEVVGRVPLTDKLMWECCTGGRFEAVAAVDLTGNLHHTGQVMLYLPERLPRVSLFGEEGCWLRVSRSSGFQGPEPCVASVQLNTVTARQLQREPELYFNTAPYDADKTVTLLRTPVASCEVWVDEAGALPLADAQLLAEQQPEDVRLEWADSVLTHCWVRWRQCDDLALAAPDARAFVLDPYEGTVSFGDGRRGRVPAPGDRTVCVRYVSGGGARGNVPAGQVNSLVGALPRISSVVNITPMSGGTDRFPQERIEAVGNKRLRHRGRAAGASDFEELVLEAFPQVLHVRCFSGRDEKGNTAPGHVTVVVTGVDDGSAADRLCDRVYAFLAERCSCCLTAEGRLHVFPATVITVSTRISVELEDLDQAAEIQREVIRRIESLIEDIWRRRRIGSQIRTDELWRVVRDTPGVHVIDRILTEGAFDEDGRARLVPLEHDAEFPYAVVRSGVHYVRVR